MRARQGRAPPRTRRGQRATSDAPKEYRRWMGDLERDRPPNILTMPFSPEEQARIGLTLRCRDTDPIPKVADAGSVHDGVQLMHNGVRVVEGGYYGAWM